MQPVFDDRLVKEAPGNQGTKSEKWARMVCIIEKSQVHSELGNETPRTSVKCKWHNTCLTSEFIEHLQFSVI